MIDEMSRISNDDPSVDDQVLLKDWCSMNTNLIHIDCDNLFFMVVGDPQRDLEIKKSKNPYFLHAPGNTYIDNIIEDLGYEMTEEEKEKIKIYHRKSLVKKVKYYASFPVFRTLLILLVLYIIYKFKKNNKRTL
jgi:hypothetical protein